MKQFEHLITTFIDTLTPDTNRDDFIKVKRQRAKDNKQSGVPTNMQILKTYFSLVDEKKLELSPHFEKLLKKRSIRSQSGIVAVQVLTKPFRCPGKCIFCPNDDTMPKSYINTQPWAMRALLNNFDPYRQVYNRLLSLKLTGHDTDKIEMIVLWGTRDVYPKKYKVEFIKGLYDACNSFQTYLEQVQIDYDNPKAARVTSTEDLKIDYPETIAESIQINETAVQRIIWLTIETRPEYVTDENCQLRRDLGITRMEMGIQTLHNHVHVANVRGHDNEAIKKAMFKLRQYGFKISNHYMPGLYMSTPEQDLETFEIAFSSPWIKSDELKFYPTAVIPNTPLYDLWKSWEYKPIEDEPLEHLIRTFKTDIIPPYARIKRLARDFDTNEVVAGANTPNLRQLVMNSMEKEFGNQKSVPQKLPGWKIRNQKATRPPQSCAVHAVATESCKQIADRLSESENASLTKRKKQYGRLATDLHIIKHIDEVSWLIDQLQPLHQTVTSSTWRDYDLDDRVVTWRRGEAFDCEATRGFVCLCTRCREVRNQKETPDSLPVLTWRTYRSSNGIEIFLSFEDRLGYLYGFTRLLLPDVWMTVDYPWLWASTAMIRELHVYGQLQSVGSIWKWSTAQHKGLWTQLLEAAEQIATLQWYQRLSVISGIGVRKYYEKKGYALEGTYMVKKV